MCINVYQYRCVRSAPKCACDRARACSLAISPIVGAHASNIKPMFLPAGLTNPKLISCKKIRKRGLGGAHPDTLPMPNGPQRISIRPATASKTAQYGFQDGRDDSGATG